MKKILLLLLLAVGLVLNAAAQDKIYKKGGEVIDATISEVGTDEIKYKIFKNPEGPVYTIEKARILKVVYQNGRTEVYQSNAMSDPELYADQAKNAIKINFLSPLLGYTQLNFEHNMRPGRSYELTLGIIGLGKKQELGYYSSSSSTPNYREQAGVFMGGGFKLSRMPDLVNGKDRFNHVMQGSYIKPELLFGFYSQNMESYNSTTFNNSIVKKDVSFGALMLNLGKQWVLGDIMILDVYAGAGYAIDNLHDNQTLNGERLESDFVGHHFAIITGADSGLGFSGGIKVGILLNKKKE
ncbi:MAG: hypothetical protein K0S09_1921 [Sphingobacteriaceae bacterium]|jgi:hypothetical protein|nr:hypothetical protein [Sphingobacteriaceae bacterium]